VIGFSVVIITFNEEANIERCLKSVADLSLDIVVVDSGSTDKTREICESYNCRFFFRSFDDYSSQKNYANSLAKNDIILSLDADECLSAELKKSITNFKNDSDNISVSFNRLNHHCGRPIRFCGWYPDRKVRIFNRKFANWKGTIHESISFASNPQSFHLSGNMLHFTYNKKSEHILQSEKFARLNAASDFRKGKKSSIFRPYFGLFLRFISIYFLKLGFLDGKTGFFIAKTSSYATFLRYRELYVQNKKKILKIGDKFKMFSNFVL
jgi:glycosyltransferase involved in cell wall biosynthesis